MLLIYQLHSLSIQKIKYIIAILQYFIIQQIMQRNINTELNLIQQADQSEEMNENQQLSQSPQRQIRQQPVRQQNRNQVNNNNSNSIRNISYAQIARIAIESNSQRNNFRQYNSTSHSNQMTNHEQSIETKKNENTQISQFLTEKAKFVHKNRYIEIQQINQNSEEVFLHILDTHLCVVNSAPIDNINLQENHLYKCKYKQSKISGYETQQVNIGRTVHQYKNHIYIKNDLVSRSHCRIYKILDDLSPLSKSFITFLYCIQNIEDYHPLAKIPKNLIKIILQYARTAFGYYLTDEGSRNGTFLQINQTYSQLKQDCSYNLAGERYELRVIKIHKSTNKQLSIAEANKQLLQKLEKRRQQNPRATIIEISQRNYQRNMKISILEISIKLESTMTYLIVSTKPHIYLGLNQDIPLDDPAVPYHDAQSQILYDKDRWWIKDGGINPSTFGTWRKLLPNQSCLLGSKGTIKLGSSVTLEFNQRKRYDQFNEEKDQNY